MRDGSLVSAKVMLCKELDLRRRSKEVRVVSHPLPFVLFSDFVKKFSCRLLEKDPLREREWRFFKRNGVTKCRWVG